MIIVLKSDATDTDRRRLTDRAAELGLRTHLSQNEERTVISVLGDECPADGESFERMEGVERVIPEESEFRLVSRDFKPSNTVVSVNGISIGGRQLAVMAGPCAVEDRVQMREIAQVLKEANVKILRAGAFKPRTSPYSFQGLGLKGLEILAEIREEFGLAVITEVMTPEKVSLVSEYADILQVGSRNMHSYPLLRALGHSTKPILLKRGMGSGMEELLMSAEYVLFHGNPRVMLCERGIRTFETYTRNTFDISAIPALKNLTHLPVIADPSHATGKWDLVGAVSKGAVAAGADGLLIEVHPHPSRALSDGCQSLRPETFTQFIDELRAVSLAVNREI